MAERRSLEILPFMPPTLTDSPEILMEGLLGPILWVKLRHLEPWTEARSAIAAKYTDLLPDSELVRPSEIPWARHVYQAHTLRADDRDSLQAVLQGKRIETGVDYPVAGAPPTGLLGACACAAGALAVREGCG